MLFLNERGDSRQVVRSRWRGVRPSCRSKPNHTRKGAFKLCEIVTNFVRVDVSERDYVDLGSEWIASKHREKLGIFFALKDTEFSSFDKNLGRESLGDRFDNPLLANRVRPKKTRGETKYAKNNGDKTYPTITRIRSRGFASFRGISASLSLVSSFLTAGCNQPAKPSAFTGAASSSTGAPSSPVSTLTSLPRTCCLARTAHASITCFCGGKQYFHKRLSAFVVSTGKSSQRTFGFRYVVSRYMMSSFFPFMDGCKTCLGLARKSPQWRYRNIRFDPMNGEEYVESPALMV